MKYDIVIYILVIVVIFVILYIWLNKTGKNDTMNKVISILYRQCARWAVAAEQDNSDIIAVLHANYAAGYLWAIKDIVSTNEFKSIIGEDFLEFESKIVKIQDNATRRLVNRCRSVIPITDEALVKAIYGEKAI